MLIVFCCAVILLVSGCASIAKKEDSFAMVNGEPITEEDMAYAMEIAHRKEDLGAAGGAIDVSVYLEKLIDDRLIMQEARIMGLDTDPALVKKMDDFILRESVMMLFNEEIASKVTVTDSEIREHYREEFEVFRLAIIATESREDAEEMKARLEKGEDFGDLAEKYSLDPTKRERGEITYSRVSLAKSPEFEKVTLSLGTGEVSDPVEIHKRFYLIKLLGREDAPDEGFDAQKSELQRALRKTKEKERSEQYLQELREKADIEINGEVVSSINMDEYKEKAKEWKDDDRILARVDDDTLTVGNLMAKLGRESRMPKKGETAEYFVDKWISYKVVDHEALRRNYDKTPGLKRKVDRYKDQLLKRSFIERMVLPQVKLDDKALEEYYEKNIEHYRKPVSFTLEEIFFDTKEEADKTSEALRKGADFSWIADKLAEEDGRYSSGHFVEAQLKEYAREVVRDMKEEGEVSPVLEDGKGRFVIIRLKARSGGEAIPLNEIRGMIRQSYIQSEVERILAGYTQQLRQDSRISINTEAIEAMQKKFGQ